MKVDVEKLFALVNHQIDHFWPKTCGGGEVPPDSAVCLSQALIRLEENFSKRNASAFLNEEGNVQFSITHSIQYMIFLYIYSNELYKYGDIESATLVYYLNKIMHSVDWFYAVNLPKHFSAEHPLGSVLGRATYGDYLFVYQNTTVGGNRKGSEIKYPRLGNNILMYSGSKILGDTIVGNNVIFSANSYAINEVIPDNSIVFGQSPSIKIVQKNASYILDRMKIWII